MYSNKLICDILNFIDKNIHFKISIDEISKIFMYDKAYIMRLFKKELHITIIDYINSKRIYNSIKELKSNSFLFVGLNNGFNSLEYFSETFKKVTKVNPSTFKKFLNLDRNLLIEDFVQCSNSITNLNILIERVDRYSKKTIPIKNNKKVLTIFK